MKKFIKILLLTLVFIFGFTTMLNPPPSGWYQQFMPYLNNMPLSDIFFLDSLTGWAVTGNNLPNDSNYILKTTNAGDNWQIKLTAYRDFFRVKFINQNTGFVCGGFNSLGNILFKSTNGGDNWLTVNAPAVIYADDISILNVDTIWYVEHDPVEGGVFRTTNGGVNWQAQYQGNNPGHIYMFNRNIGFMSSPNSGALYRTTNSGLNWVQVSGTDGFKDMFFVDSLTGWKASGFMRKTTDGGLTWIQQVMPSGGIIIGTAVNKISGLNKDTLWGVGGEVFYGAGQFRGILYRTTNGGDNWLFQIPDTTIHLDTYTQIQFINKRVGWAYRYEGGIHTTNGGDTNWLTGLKQISSSIPKEYKLFQNYPNPFNPNSKIKFQISKPGNVVLKVFDILGREMQTLVNQRLNAGIYETNFDGSNFSSGVYLYRLVTGYYSETKKMILIK